MESFPATDAATGNGKTNPIESTISESLSLLDIDDIQNLDEDKGLISPRQLKSINFRSFVGHTDEVRTPTVYHFMLITFISLDLKCFDRVFD